MKKLLLSVLLLFTMVASATAQEAQSTSQETQATTQEMQTVTQEQAIEIATQYLISNGVSMDEFRASDTPSFNDKRGWHIMFFQTKTHMLGGDFSVIVSPDGKTVTGGGSM